ncbi:MAG: hypothetical protein FJ087_19875 [Deltaproteobacteria bacterium]|nr:hypothetical protein [Deltaproteobacteria bacterium]
METTVKQELWDLFTPEEWWTAYEYGLAPRYEALYEILTDQTQGAKGFRIGSYDEWMGMSPDIDVFLFGGSAEGDLVGVWTVSIET